MPMASIQSGGISVQVITAAGRDSACPDAGSSAPERAEFDPVLAARYPRSCHPSTYRIRDATGFASTSTSEVLTTVIHEPWRDSASTFIVQGIILNQKTPAPLIFWRRS